jgi:hypothetical protein
MKVYLSKFTAAALVIIALTNCTIVAFSQNRKTIDAVQLRNDIQKESRSIALPDRALMNQQIVKSATHKPSSYSRAGQMPEMNDSQKMKLSALHKSARLVAAPDLLKGTFYCKGLSYWGVDIIGETVITADETNNNKIWIENLIPGSSTHKVYGTVAADQTTISIPQGQTIFKEGLTTGKLSIYNSNSALSGKFDPATGVLTITTEGYWGALSNDGWVDLFSISPTYTRLDMLPAVAAYRQPAGGVFYGLNPDTWDQAYNSCIIASPFVTWNWRNNALDETAHYSWSCEDMVHAYTHTSDQDSLVMKVADSNYETPVLIATSNKGFTSTSVLGAEFVNDEYESYIIAGGDATWLGFSATNDYGVANLDRGFTYYDNGPDSYYFGTGASAISDDNFESLIVYYEEPQSPLYFEGVNVYLFVLSGPASTPLTMNVYTAEKSEEGFSIKGERIASSSLMIKDATPFIYQGETYGYTLEFSDFEAIDEDGFFITKEYFDMEEDFYLELTGFNVPGVSLAVATEELNPSDGESLSLFTYANDPSLYSWNENRQTMYFNLSGAAFSYIWFSLYEIWDNKAGGTYFLDVMPYFDTLYFAEQTFPEWIDAEIVSQEYSENNWVAKVKVTIDAIAESDPARYYDLVFKTTGATRSIKINQGGPVSTKNRMIDEMIVASKNDEGFLISYPKEVTVMSVYSSKGAFMGKYNLPVSGQFQLATTTFTKGIYLLKLQGENHSATIKISR